MGKYYDIAPADEQAPESLAEQQGLQEGFAPGNLLLLGSDGASYLRSLNN